MTTAFEMLGVLAVCVGVGMISVPAAVVVFGVALIALAALADIG